jgi:hypothetical protein
VSDTEDLEERIVVLESQLEELLLLVERQPAAVRFPMPRWNWRALSDHRLVAERTDLAQWVIWLTETYALHDRWPVCWYEHGDVVMWVLALRTWHRAVYAPELEAGFGDEELRRRTDESVGEALPRTYWEWHTNALRPLLTDILPSLTKQCAAQHVEPSAEIQRHHDDHRAALKDGVRQFARQGDPGPMAS